MAAEPTDLSLSHGQQAVAEELVSRNAENSTIGGLSLRLAEQLTANLDGDDLALILAGPGVNA